MNRASSYVWVYAKRVHSKVAFLQLKYREPATFQYKFKQAVFRNPAEVAKITVGSCLKGHFYNEEASKDNFFKIEKVYESSPPFQLTRIQPGTVLRATVHTTKPYATAAPSELRGPAALGKLKVFLPLALTERGMLCVATPTIAGTGAEGGASVFKVDYFGQKAVLAQSKQLYKQMLMTTGVGPIFELSATFRAEHSDTNRHLSEFTTLDIELPCEQLSVLVAHALETIQSCFLILGHPVPSVHHYTFAQARKTVGGDPLRDLSGQEIMTLSQQLVVVTHFPSSLRPFYTKGKGTSDSFDIFYRGIELLSGSLRECDPVVLREQIDEAGIPIDTLHEYLNYFTYGMPSTGGYGIGLERVVFTLLKLNDVRDAVWIVRDRHRLSP